MWPVCIGLQMRPTQLCRPRPFYEARCRSAPNEQNCIYDNKSIKFYRLYFCQSKLFDLRLQARAAAGEMSQVCMSSHWKCRQAYVRTSRFLQAFYTGFTVAHRAQQLLHSQYRLQAIHFSQYRQAIIGLGLPKSLQPVIALMLFVRSSVEAVQASCRPRFHLLADTTTICMRVSSLAMSRSGHGVPETICQPLKYYFIKAKWTISARDKESCGNCRARKSCP